MSYLWYLSLLVSSALLIIQVKSESFEVIEIENGMIRGELRDFYYAFEGIPYAEPPVNENRFAPTKPLKHYWGHVRNCTKIGASCMQWDHLIHEEDRSRGSEDCLFLNVYVPKSVLESKQKKVPVFYYVHGGAFMFGSADFYSPDRFMTRDVILVTIHYRLGPLGFLSTEDEVISGNMGLKDQVMALRWINDNIHQFSGDKDSITITGFSAGGASVHLHYLSPLTDGLFKNGISFSGCALNPWVMSENSKEKAYRIAHNVGCPTNDHKELLKCLREKPAVDIVRSVKMFQPFLFNPFSPFGVVAEAKNSESIFLSDLPSVLLKEHKNKKLPWLATVTQDEGIYPAGEFYDDKHLQMIENEWETLAPHLFDFNHTFSDEERKLEISRKIREHYLEDGDSCHRLTKKHFNQLRDIFSDRLYNYGIRKALYMQSEVSPTFLYLFDHKVTFGIGEHFSGDASVNLGVSHGEDIVLLLLLVREELPLNAEEYLMSEKLLDMIINFNKNSQLTFNGLEVKAMSRDHFKYLKIKTVESSFVEELKDFGNGKFWDEVFYKHVVEN